MTESGNRQPYGQAVPTSDAPAAVTAEVEPGRIPSGVVWAYMAIAGTFFCPPFGLFAGIYALSREPITQRARNLAVTAIIFSGFAILSAVAYIILGPQPA